jgi:hypothetical protein
MTAQPSTWTSEEEASFARIMVERKCSRIQAIHLHKRGDPKPVTGGELIPPSAEVKHFADTYRVRARRDECGELILPGRIGHVYEHGAGRFGVYLSYPTKRAWSSAKRTLTATGFTIRQNGDMEGTVLFDPENEQQARLALTIARIRKRRVLTAEQRQRMADRMRSIKKGVSVKKSGNLPPHEAEGVDSPCSGQRAVSEQNSFSEQDSLSAQALASHPEEKAA